MNSKLINESLRVLRLFWGKTQADMAEILGISQSYLSEIEAGRKQPTLDLLQRYSECLHVPLSKLMFFAERLEGAEPPRRGRILIAGRVLNLLKKMIPDDAE
jgi:transcriptional regulator with XRE-family HTH domain